MKKIFLLITLLSIGAFAAEKAEFTLKPAQDSNPLSGTFRGTINGLNARIAKDVVTLTLGKRAKSVSEAEKLCSKIQPAGSWTIPSAENFMLDLMLGDQEIGQSAPGEKDKKIYMSWVKVEDEAKMKVVREKNVFFSIEDGRGSDGEETSYNDMQNEVVSLRKSGKFAELPAQAKEFIKSVEAGIPVYCQTDVKNIKTPKSLEQMAKDALQAPANAKGHAGGKKNVSQQDERAEEADSEAGAAATQ